MEQVQPSIEEMNIVIAKFDGFNPRFVEYPDKALNRWEIDKGSNWKPMEYDTSWDWLHHVWDKFRVINFINHPLVSDYMSHLERISNYMSFRTITDTHKAVYKAITWYNQQKQSI